ncbi:MAG: polysaccharide biosynthesis protein [Candidatus Staskawiczbacteria bacterium RIFCSPLOWO2_01_FULL_38_12b]|uniref:Polysaccharide biosynthesis protein n=1 Tax=Candidatus Staskawiczbacteria bacterium RIFCSPLOWO2_01_FULL_38_12b TaxID=1802214 RepID=A0A1G2IC31_9BACT|nr:MAG: polysaccharide biosynthesis protein [Candidatus Staskawiczbacteria bacterium RIFCSPLOWO2_01_FULL_38_12b]
MYNIPLSKQDITDLEKTAVLEVLNSPKLALGPKLQEFEKLMADFVGVKYAIAVNSGTSGLHLIVKSLGIKKGDEVITTPFSFIASANCILYEGAKPVFVDIDQKTLNIDVTKIEKKITKKTKAILAVDVFSQPADWDALKRLAKKHHLFLIEDSAEALGSLYKNKKCGSFGDAAVFAFYPNKQMTTGEGGMILTNNKKIAELCKSMSNQGRKIKDGAWLEHVRLGYNYRLDEMSAALGVVQMKRINELLGKRAMVAKLYQEKLKDIKDVQIPYTGPESSMSWFVYVVKLSEKLAGKKRNTIIKEMEKRGIQCSNYFQVIHLQPFYKELFGYKKGDYPVAEHVSQRTLALPFFNDLKEDEVDRVVNSLKECLTYLKKQP